MSILSVFTNVFKFGSLLKWCNFAVVIQGWFILKIYSFSCDCFFYWSQNGNTFRKTVKCIIKLNILLIKVQPHKKSNCVKEIKERTRIEKNSKYIVKLLKFQNFPSVLSVATALAIVCVSSWANVLLLAFLTQQQLLAHGWLSISLFMVLKQRVSLSGFFFGKFLVFCLFGQKKKTKTEHNSLFSLCVLSKIL